jgi:cell division protein ZapA (FtsZ GTPase activity inhibitor)
VKTSFGYIGIISLSILWSVFILNDLGKLLVLCYEETKDLLEKRRQRKEKEQIELKEIEQVTIELEQDQYLQDLDEKLNIIHLRLVEVCVARRAREH